MHIAYIKLSLTVTHRRPNCAASGFNVSVFHTVQDVTLSTVVPKRHSMNKCINHTVNEPDDELDGSEHTQVMAVLYILYMLHKNETLIV